MPRFNSLYSVFQSIWAHKTRRWLLWRKIRIKNVKSTRTCFRFGSQVMVDLGFSMELRKELSLRFISCPQCPKTKINSSKWIRPLPARQEKECWSTTVTLVKATKNKLQLSKRWCSNNINEIVKKINSQTISLWLSHEITWGILIRQLSNQTAWCCNSLLAQLIFRWEQR